MPAQKKDPSVRRRRNSASTKATLTKQTRPKIPGLPPHPSGGRWHTQAVAFWRDVWASPMSPEWDPVSDPHNVLACALLVHDMWTTESAAVRMKAASEFRLQRASLGLSPYDRRRLEWQIEETEEKQDRGVQRRTAKKAAAKKTATAKKAAADPRAHLHAV